MKTLITAVPSFDSDMSVRAYRLYSGRGASLLGMMEGVASVSDSVTSPGLDFIKTIGVEPLTGGLPLFADISEYNLLMRDVFNLSIPSEQLVCVLSNKVKADDTVVSRCEELRAQGFKIAVEGILDGNAKNPLFSLIDYIVISVDDFTLDSKFIDTLKILTKLKTVVLSDVHSMETFEKLAGISNTQYCGSFFNQPVTKKSSKISPVKINALALLRRINEEDFDLGEIADTIGRDPSLSISLFRFINSVVPRKIKSLRNAVAILGQKEVKRWATAAISIQLSEDKPGEITRLSLIRARFAENLAGAFEMGIFAPSLFVMGLFSLLDVILDCPMEHAVTEVGLNDDVKAALVENKGAFYKILDLMDAYERANWDDVAMKLVKYNLDLEDITTAFVDALVWYKSLFEPMDDESDDSDEE